MPPSPPTTRPEAPASSGRLERGLDRIGRVGAWLVLPLALLLCAQWPLRDLVGAGSRQANDLAQWIFAVYVALAVREATRHRAHLAAGLAAGRSPGRDRLDRVAGALLVLPWSLFVVASGAASTWASVVSAEHFPDTGNPLYFVIRVAAFALAALVSVQAVLDLARPRSRPR